MYKNILLPIDRGYKSNKKAANEAIKIANAFDSTIHILYVKVKGYTKINSEIEPITDMKSFFKNKPITNINYNVKEGKPLTQICNYENDNNINLIVMATHDKDLIKKYIIGSLTDETIQNASCPVLTMKI